MALPLIEIVCVTYRQPGPLKVLVQSFVNQTADNWKLSVWHDGPDPEFHPLMAGFAERDSSRISHHSTPVRHNDFGHSLRDQAIQKAESDFLLLTNGDNYYVPRFIATMNSAIRPDTDVLVFDFVQAHSYTNGGPDIPPYSFFSTQYRRFYIDIGAAIVRSSLAKAVGFRDKSAAGDATYFEDLLHLKPNLTVYKVPQILFVHN